MGATKRVSDGGSEYRGLLCLGCRRVDGYGAREGLFFFFLTPLGLEKAGDTHGHEIGHDDDFAFSELASVDQNVECFTSQLVQIDDILLLEIHQLADRHLLAPQFHCDVDVDIVEPARLGLGRALWRLLELSEVDGPGLIRLFFVDLVATSLPCLQRLFNP